VKLTSAKKGVAYSAVKVFNSLPSNISALQENKPPSKSALRKYHLTRIIYSREEFLAYNSDKKQ
jgi:hypothetical protein